MMGKSSEQYRQRAAHCRELAKTARDALVIQRLTELAEDLEAESREIDDRNVEQT